ncbi:MAG: exodeoxyribonuclease V subunit beta [Desulfobacterales bacterium]
MYSGTEIPETQNQDPLWAKLEGSNLIEASAGTGKTYTIAGLFLRLILEKTELSEEPPRVDEILVVTFTDAAKEELKDRIRSRLREAAEVLSGNGKEIKDDPFLKKFVASLSLSEREAALGKIKDAIRDFDEAAIFTIHAFCLRMLQEHAFESGSLFDTELMTDEESIKQEIVEDFWRRHFYTASPMFVKFAMESEKISKDYFLSLVGNLISRPDMQVIPDPEMPNFAEDEKNFMSLFTEVQKLWQNSRADVEKILLEDKGLNRKKYPTKSIPAWMEQMDEYLKSETPNPLLFKNFDRFTVTKLKEATKEKHRPPSDPFFDRCEELLCMQNRLKQHLLYLKTQLFVYARQEMKQRAESRNIRFFGDLLTDLRDALHGDRGEELAARIRGKYKAALIDEFQDTDPVQYEIFKTLFHGKDRILFLIGDPKQAIYSFRGADIFAYMRAAGDVQLRHTLSRNWRSEPDLIKAVNTIFQNRNNAFVYEEISFLPVNPPDKDRESLTFSGKREKPLQIWVVPGKQDAKGKDGPVSQEEAGEMIVRAVGAEISRLVRMGQEGSAHIGKEKLGAGDIAVLVRKKKEADKVQNALADLGIPSVLHSSADIFDSHEALEMERLLSALAQPRNETLIRTALATDMMGCTGEELERLKEEESAWEEWLVKFGDYSRIWNTRGFIRMFRQFLAGENVLPRLMALPRGERRCTNVLHLSELLHHADIKNKIGMTGLLKWLSEQRLQKKQRQEDGQHENQLRLESDEKAVKLVTMHKCKGLEYPVVFCPFTWHESEPVISIKKGLALFHEETDKGKTMICDLGSEAFETHSRREGKETLAENLRLLYVALTRARNRCYLVWGRIRSAGTSAPAWLFHAPDTENGDLMLEAAKEKFTALTDADMMNAMKELESSSQGTIAVSHLPMEPGEKCSFHGDRDEFLNARTFDGKIADSFRISSFSSLVSEKPHTTEIADYDAQARENESASGPVSPEEDAEIRNIFSFPRGTVPGSCLHKIFEELDFILADQAEIQKLVSEKLDQYGIDPEWAETVTQMIENVLSVPLEADRADFTLSRIPCSERMNELEFYFPMKTLSPAMLQTVFETWGSPDILGTSGDFPRQIGNLKFSRTEGFMKGFADLVFRFNDRCYLADWKSNYLGDAVQAYHRDILGRVMREELYILQYHIYTLALHRYLRLRMPDYDYEKHFGGVFYIFLRGVDKTAGPDFGIFRDRPRRELIQELERVICG